MRQVAPTAEADIDAGVVTFVVGSMAEPADAGEPLAELLIAMWRGRKQAVKKNDTRVAFENEECDTLPGILEQLQENGDGHIAYRLGNDGGAQA
jgi:hypothetical protein